MRLQDFKKVHFSQGFSPKSGVRRSIWTTSSKSRALTVEINLQINSVEVNITETLRVINSRGRKILQFCEGINMRHFE